MAGNMIKIASLWRYKSEKSVGGEYFMTNFGNATLLMFHNPSSHPKSPAFDLCIAPTRKTKPKPPTYAAKPAEEMPESEFNKDLYTDAPPDEGEIEDEDILESPHKTEDEDTEPPF